MGILNKDKYLRDIASAIGRGAVHFESGDRPSFMMGGRQVYIHSVSFDSLSGEMTYTVCNAAGKILTSDKGVRRLSELGASQLRELSVKVGDYIGLRRERMKNLVNIESRLKTARPKLGL